MSKENKEGNCSEISDEEIDETIEETFPASDPPSWTLGIEHCSSAEKNDSDDIKE
jgi:hypothetical protein